MDLALTGSVALVTGASRGIGRAIAEAFVREGADVAVTARSASELAAAARDIERLRPSARALPIPGDMTREADVRGAIDRTRDVLGPIDHVVGNVGSGRSPGGFNASVDDWTAALETNLVSAMILARATAERLPENRGTLTFVGSIAGLEAIGAPVPYGAAKAALLHATKSLARLAAPRGVRVNLVAPGNVLFDGGVWDRKLRESREQVEGYINREVPLRRFGRPEEIADAVLFLASARASFITGACLVVDGGQTRAT